MPDTEAGDIVASLGAKDRGLGHALFSDRSQIVLRMVSHGETQVDTAFWHARLDPGPCVSRVPRRRRRGLSPGTRRSRPAAVAHRRSLRRLPGVQALSQGMDRLSPTLVAMLVEHTGAEGHPRPQRSQGQAAGRAGAERRRPLRGGAGNRHGPRRPGHVQGGSLEGPEDRPLPRPTREPGWRRHNTLAGACWTASVTTAGSLSGWRRWPTRWKRWTLRRRGARISAERGGERGLQHRAREVNVFDELRRLERADASYDTIVSTAGLREEQGLGA